MPRKTIARVLVSAFSLVSLGAMTTAVSATVTKCPTVVAHKGFHWPWNAWPENSLAAIDAAHRAHATWVETDVMLSRSGMPIIMHGGTVFHDVTGRRGTPANWWTWDLTHMRMRDAPGHPFTTQHVPTMLQYLQRAKQDHMNVEIEVSPWGAKQFATYVHILKSVRARYFVRVSGTSVSTLAHIRRAYPGMKTNLLVSPSWPPPVSGIGGSVQEDPMLGYLTPTEIRALILSGIRVDVWTPDTRSTILTALALHPTMITTDNLSLYHKLSGC